MATPGPRNGSGDACRDGLLEGLALFHLAPPVSHLQALVTQADLVASNGVVHIIDDLLLPFRNEREWQEQIDQVPCGSGDGASTQPSSTQCGDLDRRVATVNQACCDELGGSYCAGGVPRGCNSGCARVVLPLFADCIDAFGTSAPTFANQFAGVAAICAQACMNTCLDPTTMNAVNAGFQRHYAAYGH